MVDGVVVFNEMVDFSMRSKRVFLLFKVDFEKEYDLFRWNFLDYMLIRFEFSEKLMYQMIACVFARNLRC